MSEQKMVKVTVLVQERHLVFEISNSYAEVKKDKNGNFLTTKSGEGHGYGISNVKNCVKKYEGEYTVTIEQEMFRTEVILMHVVGGK